MWVPYMPCHSFMLHTQGRQLLLLRHIDARLLCIVQLCLASRSLSCRLPHPAEVPFEAETPESEGSFHESIGPSEEVSFLCAETSEVLHASLHGKPACNCRGTFRAVTHPSSKARLCRARACAAPFAALD